MRKTFLFLLLWGWVCLSLSATEVVPPEEVVVLTEVGGNVPLQADTMTVETSSSWVQVVTNWYTEHMNYGSLTALMTIESSFIPFPSEVVIPPAAYVADEVGSSLCTTPYKAVNIFLIILFGTLGAMLGACINYGLAAWLGRPVIYRFADSKLGHLLLLSGEKVSKAETYFNEHGKVSTFVGRLIPGIRQLISIPAGLAKMNFPVFLGYTFLGAFIWDTVLALIGMVAGNNKELIEEYSHELSFVVLGIVVLWGVITIVKRLIARKTKKQ